MGFLYSNRKYSSPVRPGRSPGPPPPCSHLWRDIQLCCLSLCSSVLSSSSSPPRPLLLFLFLFLFLFIPRRFADSPPNSPIRRLIRRSTIYFAAPVRQFIAPVRQFVALVRQFAPLVRRFAAGSPIRRPASPIRCRFAKSLAESPLACFFIAQNMMSRQNGFYWRPPPSPPWQNARP